MSSSEALTDEFVAQILARDAKDRSIKYSTGRTPAETILEICSSDASARPTSNAPKPNTRFLKNIIKETDNHNAALRAKEVADARLRLRGINGSSSRRHRNEGHREEGLNGNGSQKRQPRHREEGERTDDIGRPSKRQRRSSKDDNDE
ncbi:MAG: hypothetical protein Q9223_007830, partial [Gallowayella weberi]